MRDWRFFGWRLTSRRSQLIAWALGTAVLLVILWVPMDEALTLTLLAGALAVLVGNAFWGARAKRREASAPPLDEET